MAKITKAPLPEYYDAESKVREWHLFCKVCGKGWALKKGDNHPGNLLALLDHARGHRDTAAVTKVR